MTIAVGVVGGLGLFLYGMNIMGDGLQKAAGNRLKKLIEVLTTNRFMAVIIGIVVTMIIQSSSATSVMVVGFVNAGLMTLKQAVGVIMGANLGTTVTAQLIAFKLSDIAPLVIGIGVGTWLFAKKKKVKEFSEILIGFGILFIGMDMMSSALEPLSKYKGFIDIMSNLKNPVVGVLVGFGVTTLLQSSSASVGLLLALSTQGIITIDMALPILYGDNIGTTTTALLSSIGTSKAAKQSALIHLIFNSIGTMMFILVLGKPLMSIVEKITPGSIERQIANAHTIFNLTTVVLLFPFAGGIVKIAEKIIRKGDEEEQVLKYIDDRIISTYSVAVGQASKEVLRMGKKAVENLEMAAESFYNKDEKLTKKVFKNEEKINIIETEITKFLVKLGELPLNDEERQKVTTLFHVINDIERVGDHADNIAEQTQYRIDNNLRFSDGAIEELRFMFNKTIELYKQSLLAFKEADINIALEVIDKEEEIDTIEKNYRASHIERLNKQQCQPSSGIIYLDIISNLERVGDHSSNISQYIIELLEYKNSPYITNS